MTTVGSLSCHREPAEARRGDPRFDRYHRIADVDGRVAPLLTMTAGAIIQ